MITGDVGGGFGTKIFMYREYPLAAEAARAPGAAGEMGRRPRRAFPGRRAGARQHRGRRGGAGRGRPVPRHALRHPRQSRRLSRRSSGRSFPYLGAHHDDRASTARRTCYVRVRGVYTNTVPVDAYRGAGRPEAAYLLERLVDRVGRETGIGAGRDPPPQLHRRRRDALQDADGDRTYDTGEFDGHMTPRAWSSPTGRASRRARAGRAEAGQDPRHRDRAPISSAPPGARARTSIVRLEKDGSVDGLSARSRTGRATPPPMPSSPRSISTCPSTGSASSRATPTGSRPATAPAARARSRSAASRSTCASREPRRQAEGARRRPARGGGRRPRDRRRRRCASPAPTGTSPSPISPPCRRRPPTRSTGDGDFEPPNADLPERDPYRRGRDRSRDRRRDSSSATRSSTISASP